MKVIKTVKSKKDLNKFALKTGAEVTDQHGRTFNAGGVAVDKKPLFKKKEPVPAPIIEKPSLDAELITKTVEQVSANTREVLTEIKNQISAIQFNAAEPITDWVFDIIRNKDEAMSIKRIVAKAGLPERTIN